MNPVIVLIAGVLGLGAYAFSNRRISGAISSNSNTENSEPPQYAQIRAKIKDDLAFYFAAAPHGGNPKFTGTMFDKNPLGTNASQREIEQLSNAIEWASKCTRSSGLCDDVKGGQNPISDDQIIQGAGNILAAVIWFKYPNASPQTQADIYVRTMKETVVDVRNLHWIKFMPFVMIAIAAVTAGVALVGSPLTVGAGGVISGGTGWTGTGTLLGTVVSTAGTTVPAGLTIAGGISQITGTPKSETEARQQLAAMFAALRQIMK